MFRHSAVDSDGRDPDRSCCETALPEQFFQRLRFQTGGRGELRLALGVLEDAVHCLERNHGAREFLPRLLCWEAEQWFKSVDRWPLFSFESICSILDLDPGEIREEIHRWRERRLRRSERIPPEKRVRTSLRLEDSSFPPERSSVPHDLQ